MLRLHMPAWLTSNGESRTDSSAGGMFLTSMLNLSLREFLDLAVSSACAGTKRHTAAWSWTSLGKGTCPPRRAGV